MPITVTISGVENQKYYTSPPDSRIDITITGTATTTIGTIVEMEFLGGGVSTSNSGASISYTFEDITPGAYNILITAYDNLGNAKAETITFFVVDKPEAVENLTVTSITSQRAEVKFTDAKNANTSLYRIDFTIYETFVDSPLNYYQLIYSPITDAWRISKSGDEYTITVAPDKTALPSGWTLKFRVYAVYTATNPDTIGNESNIASVDMISRKVYTERTRVHKLAGELNTSPVQWDVLEGFIPTWKTKYSTAGKGMIAFTADNTRGTNYGFGSILGAVNNLYVGAGIGGSRPKLLASDPDGPGEASTTRAGISIFGFVPGYLPEDAVWNTGGFYTAPSLFFRTGFTQITFEVEFTTREYQQVKERPHVSLSGNFGLDTDLRVDRGQLYFEEIFGDVVVTISNAGEAIKTVTFKPILEVDPDYRTRSVYVLWGEDTTIGQRFFVTAISGTDSEISSNDTIGTYMDGYTHTGTSNGFDTFSFTNTSTIIELKNIAWFVDGYDEVQGADWEFSDQLTQNNNAVQYAGTHSPTCGGIINTESINTTRTIIDGTSMRTNVITNFRHKKVEEVYVFPSCTRYQVDDTFSFYPIGPGAIPGVTPAGYTRRAEVKRDYHARITFRNGIEKQDTNPQGDAGRLSIKKWIPTVGSYVFHDATNDEWEDTLEDFKPNGDVPTHYGYLATWAHTTNDDTNDEDDETYGIWEEAFTGREGSLTKPFEMNEEVTIEWVKKINPEDCTTTNLEYEVERGGAGTSLDPHFVKIKPEGINKTTTWRVKYKYKRLPWTSGFYNGVFYSSLPHGLESDYDVDDDFRRYPNNNHIAEKDIRWYSKAEVGKIKIRNNETGEDRRKWLYLWEKHLGVEPFISNLFTLFQAELQVRDRCTYKLLDLTRNAGGTIVATNLELLVKNINDRVSTFGLEAKLEDFTAQDPYNASPSYICQFNNFSGDTIEDIDTAVANTTWGLQLTEAPEDGWDEDEGWIEIPVYQLHPASYGEPTSSIFEKTNGILLPPGWGDGEEWDKVTELRGYVRTRNHSLEWWQYVITTPTPPGTSQELWHIQTKKHGDGRIYKAYHRPEGPDVWVQKYSRQEGDSYEEVNTGVKGEYPCIDINRENGRAFLYVIEPFIRGQAHAYYTDDDWETIHPVSYGAFSWGGRNLLQMFTYKDPVSGLTFLAYVSTNNDIWMTRFRPDGQVVPFGGAGEWPITPVGTAQTVTLSMKNGVLMLDYIDLDEQKKVLFSRDFGEFFFEV